MNFITLEIEGLNGGFFFKDALCVYLFKGLLVESLQFF